MIFLKDLSNIRNKFFVISSDFLNVLNFSIPSHHILRAPIPFLISCIAALKPFLAEKSFDPWTSTATLFKSPHSGEARAFPGGRVAHPEGQNEEEDK